MQLCVRFCVYLLFLAFIFLNYLILLTWLGGHSPRLCPFPRCVQWRTCGRSPSLGPRCSPLGSGRGSGSGMWICSLRGHKGQTNRQRHLKIPCLHKTPLRSDGNSALFSQNTSGTYDSVIGVFTSCYGWIAALHSEYTEEAALCDALLKTTATLLSVDDRKYVG